MKYRKIPVVIEAIQYTGDNKEEIIRFTGGMVADCPGHSHVTVDTLEGFYNATVGDYIIKGVRGEFYPCKPDIFGETYEAVEDLPPTK